MTTDIEKIIKSFNDKFTCVGGVKDCKLPHDRMVKNYDYKMMIDFLRQSLTAYGNKREEEGRKAEVELIKKGLSKLYIKYPELKTAINSILYQNL